MRDIPILFSDRMVRALLREAEAPGTGKTETRRLAWRAPKLRGGVECEHGYDTCPDCDGLKPSSWRKVKPGDRLWVRETFSGPHEYSDLPPRAWFTTTPIWYWADGNPAGGDWTKPRPGIHMPHWASRLTLLVNSVRVERLQEITEEGARAEGAILLRSGRITDVAGGQYGGAVWQTARGWFRERWNDLHGPGAWDLSPEVCVLSFSVAKRNFNQRDDHV
jgi:hypothetical protein